MTTAAADPRSRFVGASILTPGDWAELDLDPATRHTSLSRAVRQATARNPALAGRARYLISFLDDVVRRADTGGAFYCASLVLPSTGPGGIVVATVLMQAVPGNGPAASMSAEDICAGLAASVSCDPDWAGADVDVVTLTGVGAAVRAEVLAGGVCLQYLVPIPAVNRFVALTFTSASVPYATSLVELFDTMAGTFRLEWEAGVGGGTAVGAGAGWLGGSAEPPG